MPCVEVREAPNENGKWEEERKTEKKKKEKKNVWRV